MSVAHKAARGIGGIRILICISVVFGVAGCGSTASTPPSVSVTLTAPTSGATVTVRHIEVLGRVQPSTAVVVISGRHVRVRQGAFATPLVLKRDVTQIAIQAHAAGYATANIETTVRYSRRLRSIAIITPSTSAPAAPDAVDRALASRANGFCEQANEAVVALPRMTTLAIAESDGRATEPILLRLIRQLQSLTPAHADAVEYAALIRLTQQSYDMASQGLNALHAGNQSQAGQLFTGAGSAGAQSSNVATSLGMPACAASAMPNG